MLQGRLAVGEMDATHIADELLTASTALAGLILVFVGSAVSGYDGYGAEQQQAVKAKYQRQGWLGFSGLAHRFFGE
jgi:hypothetical protein